MYLFLNMHMLYEMYNTNIVSRVSIHRNIFYVMFVSDFSIMLCVEGKNENGFSIFTSFLVTWYTPKEIAYFFHFHFFV